MATSLAVIGEVGGRYSYTSTNADMDDFVHRSRDNGAGRLVFSYYHSPSKGYPSYLRHRDRLMRVEPYSYGPASPLHHLVAEAHRAGLQVEPFINVATGGQWIRADYMASGEVWPYTRLVGGGRSQDRYWTKTRDGATWLDIGPRDPLGAYGYTALSFPQVRARERAVYVDWVRQFHVDGVQLELMIAHPPKWATQPRRQTPSCDAQGVWAYGFDPIALEDFRSRYGLDARDLANADPRWVAARAQYLTDHVQEVRREVKAANEAAEVSLLAFSGLFNSPDEGKAVGSDWLTWLSTGLFDSVFCRVPGEFVPFAERFTVRKIRAMGAFIRDLRALVEPRATLWPVMELPTYPLSLVKPLSRKVALARTQLWTDVMLEAGATHLGIWWFDTITQLELWDTVRYMSDKLESVAATR